MLVDLGNLKQEARLQFSRKEGGLRIQIETERLWILSYDDRDFQDCVTLYGNQKITRYFDHGKPRTLQEVEQMIETRGRKYLRQGLPFGLFSLFHKPEKSFMGQIDLLPTDHAEEAEIGFILHSEYHNQGYCTEAMHALLQFVYAINRWFEGVSIHKLIATVHPANISSIKVLEKIGMKYQNSLTRFGCQRNLYSMNVHAKY